jgi:hypothetical protein
MDQLKELKEEKMEHYKCSWPGCGYEFDRKLALKSGGSKHGHGRIQIRCPHCKNFLETI